MTLRVKTVAVCDSCGKREDHESPTTQDYYGKTTINLTAPEGWYLGYSGDFFLVCPACRKDVRR
jgi:hypothetical protein